MFTKLSNHFVIYISQTIMSNMFHTLNIYSAVYQLYPNKTGRKRKRKEHIMLDFTFSPDSEH